MSVRFENLQEEKRQRIINACIEEFAQNGYEKASTNVIVKNAGISKGILFHYFGSKKNLFLFTVEYVMEYFINKYSAEKKDQPSDIFERLLWFGLWKLKVSAEQPMMSKMLVTAFNFMSNKLEKEMNDIVMKAYAYIMPPLMEGIDSSKFREGVDPNKVIELINIFINGLSDKYMKMYKEGTAEELLDQVEKIREEYEVYLDIIKFGAYSNIKYRKI